MEKGRDKINNLARNVEILGDIFSDDFYNFKFEHLKS